MSAAPRLTIGMYGGIGRATLSRPELQNPLDVQTAVELRHALEEFEADPDVRAVLIAGQGDHFSGAMLGIEIDEDAEDAWILGRVFLAIRQMSKPVVAAVQGRVIAGGAGLATACDMVLAREDAVFGYPEVRLGSVPALVMTMLRRSVGEKHAFDLVASGRMVAAVEAERIGLVSRVLSTAAFPSEVERIVLGLASHSTTGMAITKKLFYALDGLDFREAIDQGVKSNAEAHAQQEPHGAPRS
ncbi:MAG TPA: enoyl-CoA hydratase/isomerase family protein [Gemmatimonadaceae bacterium]